MLLLCNENVPGATVRTLRSIGHDVLSIAESAPGIPDDAVMELARLEDRVIITFDRDYGDLIFRDLMHAPPGLIYLRFIPREPDEPAQFILQLLATPDISLPGQFTVLSRDHIRQRAIPPPGAH